MSFQRMSAEFIASLASRLKPTLVNNRWRPAAISAKNRARLRKEALVLGLEWPYDEPHKEMSTRMKGHKCDRDAKERHKKIEENMAKMPEILAQWRKRKAEQKTANSKN